LFKIIFRAFRAFKHRPYKRSIFQEEKQDHVARMEILRRHAGEHQDTRKYLGAAAGAMVSDQVRDYALKTGFYVEQPGGMVKLTTAPEPGNPEPGNRAAFPIDPPSPTGVRAQPKLESPPEKPNRPPHRPRQRPHRGPLETARGRTQYVSGVRGAPARPNSRSERGAGRRSPDPHTQLSASPETHPRASMGQPLDKPSSAGVKK
jgi:hypothetical protein